MVARSLYTQTSLTVMKTSCEPSATGMVTDPLWRVIGPCGPRVAPTGHGAWYKAAPPLQAEPSGSFKPEGYGTSGEGALLLGIVIAAGGDGTWLSPVGTSPGVYGPMAPQVPGQNGNAGGFGLPAASVWKVSPKIHRLRFWPAGWPGTGESATLMPASRCKTFPVTDS